MDFRENGGNFGVRIPAYFTTDPQLLYDFITNFQTKPDDVFIVSYPKSGKLLEKTTHAICSKWQRTGRSCEELRPIEPSENYLVVN